MRSSLACGPRGARAAVPCRWAACPSAAGAAVRPRAARRAGLAIKAVAEAPQAPKPAGGRRGPQKKMADEDLVEKGMRELPRPADVQQTLVTSFTLGGVGLHTGEYAYVRVRPAFAGEGRYFVRVPKGTNCDHFAFDDGKRVLDEEDLAEAMIEETDEEFERAKVELFTRFLAAQEDEGFKGDFLEYLNALDAEPLNASERRVLREAFAAAAKEANDALLRQGQEPEIDPDAELFPDELDLIAEDIVAASPGQDRIIPADLSAAYAEEGLPYLALVGGDDDESADDDVVLNPTLLLSALEACGIDNARIEIEGGREVPVLDNSALGWTLNIQQSGTRIAPMQGSSGSGGGGDSSGGEEREEAAPRMALMPGETISVQRGESFVTFHPGPFHKLTAGVDVQDESAIIGQQWYSWRVGRDYHYRYELAPARGWVASVDRMFQLRGQGFIKAGSEGNIVIGHGERWWDPQLVRFHNDEPARFNLLQLLGALALVGAGGHSGLPCGHIVAFNADVSLLLDFARKLVEVCEDKDVVVDSSDLLTAQMALMDEEEAERDVAGSARRARDEALAAMGPVSSGGGEAE